MNTKGFLRIIFLFAFTAITSMGLYAQDSTQVSDRSLNGMYNDMLRKSKTLNTFKVINPLRLSDFYKHYMDTLNTERKKLAKARKTIDEQAKTITTLQASVTAGEKSLSESNMRVDEIQLLGLSFTKTSYSSMMWGIVLALTIALVFIVIKSISYRKEATHRIQLFNEVSAEYQMFKIKSSDKEKKLARELQDERNKLEDLVEATRNKDSDTPNTNRR